MTDERNLEEEFTSDAEESPTDLEGTVIDSRYEVIRRIGSGGMGVVYLAKQRGIGREVVVKVMRSSLSDDSEGRARFEREAQGLSKLQHQNVVTVFDFGRDGDLFFIVMEYVEGESLARFLRRRDHLNFATFGPIAVQILSAIAEAHREGIIHRDLKPGNVMLCKRQGHSNFVKVLDFGLAKLMNSKNDVTKKTDIVGSAAFMAPEQILGDRAADQRVDVYSLGVLLYFMLSGKKPFEADDDLTILYHQVHTPPPSLAEALPPKHDVPQEVIRLIDRCLRKAPAERPRDAGEIIELLRDGVESSSVFSTPWTNLGDHTPFPRPRPSASMSPERDSARYAAAALVEIPKSKERNKLVPVLGGAVLLLLVLLGFLFLREKPVETPVTTKVEIAEKGPETAETDTGDRSGIARGMRVAGLAALESGDYEEAVKSFTKALQLGGAGDDVGELLQIARTLLDNSTSKTAKPVEEKPVAVEPVKQANAGPARSVAAARPVERPRPSTSKPTEQQEERVETGMLLIASTPNGVVFKLNDDDGGVTPMRVSLPVGLHTVTYFQNGAPISTRKVTVREGTLTISDVDLRPTEPVIARVEAEVKADPTPTPTPTPVEVAPKTETPTVASAVTKPPTETEAKAMGELMIESPNVYGEVWVNGKQVGYPPTVVKNIPVGAANVEIKVDGKTRRSQRVRVTEQKRITVRL